MGEILNEWEYRQARAQLRTAETSGQAAELAGLVASFEALRSAGGLSLELTALEDLGGALIKARIARGWTHAQLAQRLQMPKQQVQRYEASEYRSASLRRIGEIARVLGIRVNATVEVGERPELAAGLAKSLAGYSAAAAVKDVEQRLRLRRMTTEEARRVFEDMCDTYHQLRHLHPTPTTGGPEVLGHRLVVRRALDELARKLGEQ